MAENTLLPSDKESESADSPIYKVIFSTPVDGKTDESSKEEMIVECPDETSIIKMLLKRLNIDLKKASAHDVLKAYRRREGVVEIDKEGEIITQNRK